MTVDSSVSVVSILQQRCDSLNSKIKNFTLVNQALQLKTYRLLEFISRQEDYSGLITKEYDKISNDINSIQTVIENYTSELEDLKLKIEQYNNEEVSKSVKLTNPTVVLPNADNSQIRTKLRLRARLPNSQFTLVEVKPGQQLRQALEKKLSHRGLRLEQLVVYRALTGLQVYWDDDAEQIAATGEELVVDFACRNFRKLEHQFHKKTFFEKTYCNLCHKLIFHGALCKICGFVYHVRCLPRADKNCLSTLDDDVFYASDQQGTRNFLGSFPSSCIHGSNWLVPSVGHIRHQFNPGDATVRVFTSSTSGVDNTNLLTTGFYISNGFTSPGGHQPRQYLTLSTRERSSSTPNVSNNLIPPNQQKNMFIPNSLGKNSLTDSHSSSTDNISTNEHVEKHKSIASSSRDSRRSHSEDQYILKNRRSFLSNLIYSCSHCTMMNRNWTSDQPFLTVQRNYVKNDDRNIQKCKLISNEKNILCSTKRRRINKKNSALYIKKQINKIYTISTINHVSDSSNPVYSHIPRSNDTKISKLPSFSRISYGQSPLVLNYADKQSLNDRFMKINHPTKLSGIEQLENELQTPVDIQRGFSACAFREDHKTLVTSGVHNYSNFTSIDVENDINSNDMNMDNPYLHRRNETIRKRPRTLTLNFPYTQPGDKTDSKPNVYVGGFQVISDYFSGSQQSVPESCSTAEIVISATTLKTSDACSTSSELSSTIPPEVLFPTSINLRTSVNAFDAINISKDLLELNETVILHTSMIDGHKNLPVFNTVRRVRSFCPTNKNCVGCGTGFDLSNVW